MNNAGRGLLVRGAAVLLMGVTTIAMQAGQQPQSTAVSGGCITGCCVCYDVEEWGTCDGPGPGELCAIAGCGGAITCDAADPETCPFGQDYIVQCSP